MTLHHLATGEAQRKANYAYLGPVFRVRTGESGEFRQAGVESFGRTDRVAADADMLQLAFAAARLFGVRQPQVRIGDSALFAALLDALGLNAPWQRRLERAFGDTQRLRSFIGKANGKAKAAPSPPAGASRAKVRAAVAAQFAETGLGEASGRSADEIAERVMEKAALAEGIPAPAAAALTDFLAISGTPAESIAALRALSRRARVDIGKAIDRFAERTEAFAAHGIDVDRLTFAADFGRRLDYYTGFVFEFRKRGQSAPIVGGGRYDRMTAHVGAGGRAVPAVGFAIWLDRIAGDRVQ